MERDAWRPASVLAASDMRRSVPVGIKAGLVATRPGCPLARTFDIPVGAASLEDRAQIETQLLDGRPAKEPVAVVDLVDAQAGLEHQRVGDHGIVMRVGVFLDLEIFLDL